MRSMALCILLLATSQLNSVLAQVAVNPVVYNSPGAQYLQNFDGLPSSGTFTLSGKGPFNLSSSPINSNNLAGWQILMPGGSNTNAAFAVGTGSSTGNGIYSLGSSGSTERALGSLSSSTGIYSMGLILTNNTGSVLNTLTISFTAEQWRKGGSTNKNIWSFRYKTGIITHMDQPDLLDEPNLNFSSVVNTSSATSLNGNLSDNQQTVSYTMHNITWKAGEQLLLRWDDADEAGSDDVVGIENFSFSATLVSTSPTINNVVAANITTGSVELNALVNDNYANTSVVFEYDTLNTLPAPIKIRASQDTLHAGSGNTNVSATVNGLSSGTTYYFRIKTNNINGTVTGTIQNFTTSISLPTVNTTIVSAVSTNTAILGGNITATGGTAVTEKGIVWSVNTNPTILNTKIIMGSGTGNFSQKIIGLPQGSVIYARAYAINAGGIAYGDTIRFATQTMITSFNTTATGKTNATSVGFIFKTAQNISGLTASNFSLQTNNLSGVSITGITGSANSYTLTVTTGTGDGTLGISFSNDAGLSIPINNKTFTATNYYTIDRIAPQINSASIPDKTMKTGDTIPVNIFVKPETDIYKMVSGNIDGFALSGFNKKNDSTYTAWFLITNGGNDIDAAADIPVMFSLIDSAGNSSQFQVPIKQQSDRIDANKPFILSVLNPPKGMYKAGDTLSFIFRFSEKIVVFQVAHHLFH